MTLIRNRTDITTTIIVIIEWARRQCRARVRAIRNFWTLAWFGLAVYLCVFAAQAQIGVEPAAVGAGVQGSQKELAGKVALITGSSRNLGRGYAVALARNGADIVVHYHLPADRGDAEETARLVRAQGSRAILVSGDLCGVGAITRMFDQTFQAFGRVDIVVNSAGRIVKKPVAEMTEQDFDSVFCVNARGAFFVMREAARRISDNGRIINIGSSLIGSTIGEYSVYAGSKAALEQFTRALAREIGKRGVTVNMVAPGPVDTPFYFSVENEESIARAARSSVAGRLGRIDDVVPLVEFLASPQSQWVTAQTIFINGGSMAR